MCLPSIPPFCHHEVFRNTLGVHVWPVLDTARSQYFVDQCPLKYRLYNAFVFNTFWRRRNNSLQCVLDFRFHLNSYLNRIQTNHILHWKMASVMYWNGRFWWSKRMQKETSDDWNTGLTSDWNYNRTFTEVRLKERLIVSFITRCLNQCQC